MFNIMGLFSIFHLVLSELILTFFNGYNKEYILLILFISIAGFLSGILMLISYIFSIKKPSIEKSSPYECGFKPFVSSQLSFDIQFYIVAILFVIFDLELVFLYPWVISLNISGIYGFCVGILFLGVLLIGFVYEWINGSLDWFTDQEKNQLISSSESN